MNTEILELVQTLRTAQPSITEEVASKVAEVLLPIANCGIGFFNARQATHLIFGAVGVPEVETEAKIEKALSSIGDVDFTTNREDFASLFSRVFGKHTKAGLNKVYSLIKYSEAETVWDCVCACPPDLWISLFSSPLS